ncbi:MAG: class I SAM-dependent methyltransferase [Planctomycetota bacterium]
MPKTSSEAWQFSSRAREAFAAAQREVTPQEASLEAWVAKYAVEHKKRLEGDLDLVADRFAQGARLLEYGASPLLMTVALQEIGFEVDAVDLAPERFSEVIERRGLQVVRCDVEREAVPFPADEFDGLLFNEIFEHLRIDPIFTMREALRVLKPGGRMLLSTPNLRSFRGLKNLFLENRAHAASGDVYAQYHKLQTLGHMGHVREYTTREVADFLTQIGFFVEETVFRGGYGRGLTGCAERLAPSLRPFFTIVASKPQASPAAEDPNA